MMRRNVLFALLLMLCLGACSSTLPPTATVPSVGSTPTAEVANTPIPTEVASDGPITASMAKLEIAGERNATLGDPAAPLTLVEFSDFG